MAASCGGLTVLRASGQVEQGGKPKVYRETFTATNSRVVTHNLGVADPEVMIKDSDGDEILIENIRHDSASQLTLTFTGVTLTDAEVTCRA